MSVCDCVHFEKNLWIPAGAHAELRRTYTHL